jgi:hypothetical protein
MPASTPAPHSLRCASIAPRWPVEALAQTETCRPSEDAPCRYLHVECRQGAAGDRVLALSAVSNILDSDLDLFRASNFGLRVWPAPPGAWRFSSTTRLTTSERFGYIHAPLFGRPVCGRILKWPTRADCKSAGLRLRRFESFSYHHPFSPEKQHKTSDSTGQCSMWPFLGAVLFVSSRLLPSTLNRCTEV